MTNAPPDDGLHDALRRFAGYTLRRASAASMQDLGDRLTPLSLRPSEASVLVLLLENPALPQRELGTLLGITSSNLAPLLARLSERGYLQRKRIDGRSVRLALTASGGRTAKSALATMQAHEDALLARLPERLRAPFAEALAALASEPE